MHLCECNFTDGKENNEAGRNDRISLVVTLIPGNYVFYREWQQHTFPLIGFVANHSMNQYQLPCNSMTSKPVGAMLPVPLV